MSLDVPQQIIDLGNKVVQLYNAGRYRKALPIATRAAELARQYWGENHPEVAATLSNLAGLYESLGEYAQAEPRYQQALAIYYQAPEENALSQVGPTLSPPPAAFNREMLCAGACWMCCCPFCPSAHLFLAPDGELTRLPFDALPVGDNRFLIDLDTYQVSYLSVGRDLLGFAPGTAGQPNAPLVVADPDFDLIGAATNPASSGSRQPRDLRLGNLHFDSLVGTSQEGEQIAALYGVQPWLQE